MFNLISTKGFLLFLLFSFTAVAETTTQKLIEDNEVNAKTKSSLSELIDQQQIQLDTLWADSAEQVLKNQTLSASEILELRGNSELTINEIEKALAIEFPNELGNIKARHARPSAPRNGALYQDIYQESPVLIDYTGEGNKVVKMSFAVVYKYLRDEDGKVNPHFVRAQLVSPGAAGHRSSVGEFDIDRRHRYYVSQTYGSRMDYAQFFIGGIAIHQTLVESYPKLGMPASHGCIRHHEYDADAMWNLMGETLEDGDMVNIKVYPFGVDVVLADGSSGTEQEGMGAELNEWLNRSIECTRRGVSSSCTKSWVDWN
ncbi:MAG: L,D-transpeptidase [Bdellovibrionota bacterium]